MSDEKVIVRLALFLAALEQQRLIFWSSNRSWYFTGSGNALIDKLLEEPARQALHARLITEGVSSSVARLAVLLDAGMEAVTSPSADSS